ncbi:MAG: hypothetical protein GF411_20020 [Candidatus Lokiarchaeota archaeon]|nr:hypothetical protein [Candidatus Lokiarchaeota archaeon]
MKRHQADWDIYDKYGEQSIRYYLGGVRLKTGKRWSEKRVRDIEAAIIYYHGEDLEFNIRNTQSYSGRSLTVTHTGSVPPGIIDFVIE